MTSLKELEAAQWDCVEEGEMRSFIQRVLCKVGARPTHADVVADVLLAADARGVYSHGLNKLGELEHFLMAAHTGG